MKAQEEKREANNEKTQEEIQAVDKEEIKKGERSLGRLRNPSFHISLYVIVPCIFAGFTILSYVLTLGLVDYYLNSGVQNYADRTFWPLMGLAAIAAACGFFIQRAILKPLEKFIEITKNLSILRISGGLDGTEKISVDKPESVEKLLKGVTTCLSLVDAKALFPDLIAESEAMRSIMSEIVKVAPTDSTVLILGESGTGKELVANSLFNHSLRKDKPFIKLNCVAIPRELWESELFGHEKGSFTGADKQKKGKFEMANTGTLFLDEIGDMPLETQAKMLRVLEEREFERVGGTKTIKVDVRFVAATNKDLKKMVEEGTFREDLYYRLNVFTILIPPLRERRDDIPILAEHFCKNAPKPASVTQVTLQVLQNTKLEWTGNVRELRNIIHRAAVMSEDGKIEPRHLPAELMTGNPLLPLLSHIDSDESLSIDDQLQALEKSMITDALRRSKGVQVRAAELLGIKQRSLWHRTRKYNIDVKAFKV